MPEPAKTPKSINVIPVVQTMPADPLTPLAVYLKLSATSKHAFLLESVEGGRSLARYSFIGAEPDFVVHSDNDQIEITHGTDETHATKGSLIDFLKIYFADHIADDDHDLPSFIGGAIGYLGFDCCEWFEPSLKSSDSAAGAAFMFFSSVVAFDHAKQVIKIISLAFTGREDDQGEETALAKALERNRVIHECLESATTHLSLTIPSDTAVETSSNWVYTDFIDAVCAIKELIYAGECYQAVLSQCFDRKTDASAIEIYRALRSLNPSPYMFLLQFDKKAIVGASPEMLVRCEDRRLEYRPIAGTRPRGKTRQEDTQLAEEMRVDKKEVAEHIMLVDLGRNDLGRVAEYGSVRVDTLMSVEKYSHVQHLVSSLSAKLKEGLTCFDALSACFPAGTVSGAPKVRATEIIRNLEPTPRGIYAGTVGYFDYTGNMDTCIAIRTLVLENGVAQIQAGAGIVADSVPELEFEEILNKTMVLMRALDLAEGRDG
jgi:anthranilate synthase component I